MMRAIALLQFLAAASLAVPIPGAAQEYEDPGQFPEAPGREETFYACVACHNFKLVAAQGMARDRWAETLVWMTEQHAMPPLAEEDLTIVLDYLSTAFGPKAPVAATKGWSNPFAKN